MSNTTRRVKDSSTIPGPRPKDLTPEQLFEKKVSREASLELFVFSVFRCMEVALDEVTSGEFLATPEYEEARERYKEIVRKNWRKA